MYSNASSDNPVSPFNASSFTRKITLRFIGCFPSPPASSTFVTSHVKICFARSSSDVANSASYISMNSSSPMADTSLPVFAAQSSFWCRM